MAHPANPKIFLVLLVCMGVASGEAFGGGERTDAKDPSFKEDKTVPHGATRMVWYQSSTLGMRRRMHVYTPPGYDDSDARYPVLYLLHGVDCDDSGWSTFGGTGAILDNLLAAKKVKPMIVVMPNGSLPQRLDPATGQPIPAEPGRFSAELMNNVIPYVEKNYRTLADKDSRAIAGLSMGAMQTIWSALGNPDKFAYIAVWSNGVRRESSAYIEKRFSAFLDHPDQTNQSVKMLWIGIGSQDPLLAYARNFELLLNKHGIRHEYHETEGGHTWINWRQYLTECAPMFFQ